MSPRRRKVGGIDDPIWSGDDTRGDEARADDTRGDEAGGEVTSGDEAGGEVTGQEGWVGQPETRDSRLGQPRPEPAIIEDSPAGIPESPGRHLAGRDARDIPRRLLVDDAGTARDDERECGLEGWFQTDDGVPISSMLRPLSVTCARPRGHPGAHRSPPRRARFRRGQVWVYEWGDPSAGGDE